MTKVKDNCNKKRTCELYAKNTVFGDPCPGTSKYLNVEYKCVPAPKGISFETKGEGAWALWVDGERRK